MTDMTRLQEMLYRADAETIAHDLKWIGEKKAQAVAALLATPPAPVDVRVAEAYKQTLASLVAAVSLLERGGKKAAPSDSMFAQMLTDYRAAIDAGRQAFALLDGQPAGVVIDDAMVRRAVHAYDEWMIEHAPDETDAYHDGMRAAQPAALGGGGRP